MNLRDRILIGSAFLCLAGLSIVNFVAINKLQEHHIEKYDKYSYAYDCMKTKNISSILMEEAKKGKYYGTESSSNHNYGKRRCNEG